jgi:hypothetical protein
LDILVVLIAHVAAGADLELRSEAKSTASENRTAMAWPRERGDPGMAS